MSREIKTYLLFNRIFLGLILVALLYCGILVVTPSQNLLPVQITRNIHVNPVSTGISRSIGYLVLGKVARAKELNRYSLRIFSFFLYILLSRIFLSLYLLKKISLSACLRMDVAFSAGFFLWSFFPFIVYTLTSLVKIL